MHLLRSICQDHSPDNASKIFNELHSLAGARQVTDLRVAVAYATGPGCRQLLDLLSGVVDNWPRVRKRWLTSIDFGHTHPDALEQLRETTRSEVRIPNGRAVLANGLQPKVCFHPKMFLFSNADLSGSLLLGSANLTLGGLHSNSELALSCSFWGRQGEADSGVRTSIASISEWWESCWLGATKTTQSFIDRYAAVRDEKADGFDTDPVSKEIVTPGAKEVSLAEALNWSRAKYFWIDAAELYKNRGEEKAGNQLDCRRGTRVYFGFSPSGVPVNTVHGYVNIRVKGYEPQQRSVRFGANGMDKVNLPVPNGTTGPGSYDHKTLLFERVGPGKFVLTLGSGTDRARWKRLSDANHATYRLSPTREFGFF